MLCELLRLACSQVLLLVDLGLSAKAAKLSSEREQLAKLRQSLSRIKQVSLRSCEDRIA